MQSSWLRTLIAVMAGLATYWLIWQLFEAPESNPKVRFWPSTLADLWYVHRHRVLAGLYYLLPGLIVGFLATNRPIILGTLVCGIASALIDFSSTGSLRLQAPHLLWGGAAIVGMLGAIFGAAAASLGRSIRVAFKASGS